jgi:hypothetical protein
MDNASDAPRRGGGRRFAIPILVGSLLAASLPGLPYYTAPIAERVRHPLHAWLKPSGTVGQAAGILALAMFLFLWLYPLRKRVRWLAFGRLPRWLDVHIVVGLALPFVAVIHAAWRFDGLVGLGYLALLLVVLSGIVGRYLYRRIPRGPDGVELSQAELDSRRRELIAGLAARLDVPPGTLASGLDLELGRPRGRTLGSAVVAVVRSEVAYRRFARRLRPRPAAGGVDSRRERSRIRDARRMIRREITFLQEMALLEATRRVFRFWHVAHLPVALTALAAVVVHVAVVVAMGVTWLW